jgi:16S rRNA C967 or C1407 C5-methylase (RsmB/RsmF family)/NOL1/NOP2/fmu family ribosome biogenesis protein
MSAIHLPEEHLYALRLQLGNEVDDLLRAYEKAAPTSLRIHPIKGIAPTNAQRVLWSDTGYYLQERPSFTHDPLFHAGCYYVQEASSMSIELAWKQHAAAIENPIVLDLCAAPGGKSTHLLSLLNGNGFLISNEVIKTRAQVLAENCIKWGFDNVAVISEDPAVIGKQDGLFDVIMADVPCSGEGLFRRDAKAISEWSTDNVKLCSARQQRIIHDIWPSLNEGGLLFYSTCTFNPEENENNLARLQEELEFETLPLTFPDGVVVKEGRCNGVFGYHFYPHLTQGEGFFLAVLRKTSRSNSVRFRLPKGISAADKKVVPELRNMLQQADRYMFLQKGEEIVAVPVTHEKLVLHLLDCFHVIHTGIPMADARKAGKPLHALALSLHYKRGYYPEVELSFEDALKFLARQDIHPINATGIHLLTYSGMPLGWINAIDKRSNNLYPQEWRIRKL